MPKKITPQQWQDLLSPEPITASAPCRIDMGGTLDISTFYIPLQYLSPATFNIAVALRTRVALHPHRHGSIRISSRGFETAEFACGQAPYDHHLGLMFAICDYFGADGVHVRIDSASPPRSAMGGSSVAAVALVAALAEAHRRTGTAPLARLEISRLAYEVEAAVAGVACGRQDQLAATYGGANIWKWRTEEDFTCQRLTPVGGDQTLTNSLLLAYCGRPHVSKNINAHWVAQFVAGKTRSQWTRIVACTRRFCDAFEKGDYKTAADAVNQEVAIRQTLTPDIFDTMGNRLHDAARQHNCGARFAGAGGGGCVWAIGPAEDITRLRSSWQALINEEETALLLPFAIDTRGVVVDGAADG